MSATVAMEERSGVELGRGGHGDARAGSRTWPTAGFPEPELDGLGANDLVLAVRGADEDDARGRAGRPGARGGIRQREQAGPPVSSEQPPTEHRARRSGRSRTPTSPIVSVPGEYAALEAHHALTAGLHVLLFSDGVPLEEEVELKDAGAASSACW